MTEIDNLLIQSILEKAGDVVVLLNRKFEILWTNNLFNKLIGFDLQPDFRFLELVHQDDKELVKKYIKEAIDLEELNNGDIDDTQPVLCKIKSIIENNNEYLHFEIKVSYIVFGKKDYIVLFMRDVSQRIHFEKEREIINAFSQKLLGLSLAISKIINTTENVKELCDAVVERLNESFNIDVMAIFLHDKKKNGIRLISSCGFNELFNKTFGFIDLEKIPSEVSVITDLYNNIYESKRLENLQNTRWLRYIKNNYFLETYPDAILIGEPIVMSDEFVCSIILLSTNENIYQDDDIILTQVISTELNKGITQKKLMSELQDTSSELEKKTKNVEEEIKKRTQRLTLEKEQAEQANKLKSQFLANMSHELRTPLNAIIGFSEQLEEKIIEPNHLKYLGYIKKGGQQLLDLINDILDLSKFESGKMEITSEKFEVSEIISDLIFQSNKQALKKNIHVVFEGRKDNRSILQDKRYFKQIVSNLLNNAIKYTKDYGKVVIRYDITENDEEQTIKIEVEDTGIGIAEKDYDKVFEKFTRVDDDSYVKSQKGTGLGLALTKGLIDFLGGKIWFKSKIDEGTTFTVVLPILKEGISPVKQERYKAFIEKPKNIELKNKSILVIEDNKMNRILLNDMLVDLGVGTVFAVENPVEGIKIAEEENVDLIFMDIQLPIMDGLKATRILRKKEKTKDIPIIAVTAYAMRGDKDKAVESGCNDYIAKPINLNKVKQIVNRYLT